MTDRLQSPSSAAPAPRAPSTLERIRSSAGARVALFASAIFLMVVVGFFVMSHGGRRTSAAAPVAPPRTHGQGLIGGKGYGNANYRHTVRKYERRQARRARAQHKTDVLSPTGQFHPARHHPRKVVRQAQSQAMRGVTQATVHPHRPPAFGEVQDLMAAWRRPGPPIAVIIQGVPKTAPHHAARPTSSETRRTMHRLPAQGRRTRGSGKVASARILIPAGKIDYGVTITAVNSNVPGPVECRLTSGPFRGDNLLGSFRDVHERLVLAFHQIVLANGHSQAISALAISPNSGLPAVRGAVDHHYLERYGLLFAGAYLQGYGQAYQQNGCTAVTGSGLAITTNNTAQYASRAALGSLGQTMAQQFTQDANIPATVSLPSGAGMGVLFMKPVVAQAVTRSGAAP